MSKYPLFHIYNFSNTIQKIFHIQFTTSKTNINDATNENVEKIKMSSTFITIRGNLYTAQLMEPGISEIVALWGRILIKIKSAINDNAVYDTFFSDSYIDSIHDNTMIVVVNSQMAATVASTQFKKTVSDIVHQATESNFEIKFMSVDEAKSYHPKKVEKQAYFSDSTLNPNYTFKTFVVGPSNREAYQASLMASQNPGRFFNPILIYGDSGLGKTHLLHAIGNAAVEKNPSLRVLYVHAQEFLNEYVKYVTSGKSDSIVDWFKESVDILLVDDVQFLSNKKATEETFFSIYNNFYNSGKQVVLTSDQHPSKLNGLDERLKSRFVQGLPLSIGAPEKEVREKILELRIEQSGQQSGLSLSDFDQDAIEYLADKFKKNIRELEGALDRLLFYIVNIRPSKHIDLSITKEAIESLVSSSGDKSELSEDKIVRTVADYYNLATHQITGKSRTGQIALARHVAMYLMRNMMNMPLTKIGAYFGGKDHTTVMSAVSKVEKELKENPESKKAIDELKRRLK